jgi:hypothetical protein
MQSITYPFRDNRSRVMSHEHFWLFIMQILILSSDFALMQLSICLFVCLFVLGEYIVKKTKETKKLME